MLLHLAVHAVVLLCSLLAWRSGLGWAWSGWRWLALALGSIAGLDAWGAAMYRECPLEAWIRGLLVFALVGLLPWWLLSR